MTIRAKFRCTSVTKTVGGTYNGEGKYTNGIVFSYKFNAVVGDSLENKTFFASTPSGSIELTAVRDDLFEVQKEYYLDFSEAEEK